MKDQNDKQMTLLKEIDQKIRAFRQEEAHINALRIAKEELRKDIFACLEEARPHTPRSLPHLKILDLISRSEKFLLINCSWVHKSDWIQTFDWEGKRYFLVQEHKEGKPFVDMFSAEEREALFYFEIPLPEPYLARYGKRIPIPLDLDAVLAEHKIISS